METTVAAEAMAAALAAALAGAAATATVLEAAEVVVGGMAAGAMVGAMVGTAGTEMGMGTGTVGVGVGMEVVLPSLVAPTMDRRDQPGTLVRQTSRELLQTDRQDRREILGGGRASERRAPRREEAVQSNESWVMINGMTLTVLTGIGGALVGAISWLMKALLAAKDAELKAVRDERDWFRERWESAIMKSEHALDVTDRAAKEALRLSAQEPFRPEERRS